MKYGCTSCYWVGEDPEKCDSIDDVCCPECGALVYTTEEVQAKMAKLISLYTAMMTKVYINI